MDIVLEKEKKERKKAPNREGKNDDGKEEYVIFFNEGKNEGKSKVYNRE